MKIQIVFSIIILLSFSNIAYSQTERRYSRHDVKNEAVLSQSPQYITPAQAIKKGFTKQLAEKSKLPSASLQTGFFRNVLNKIKNAVKNIFVLINREENSSKKGEVIENVEPVKGEGIPIIIRSDISKETFEFVVNALAQQSGLDVNVIKNALAQLDPDQVSDAIKLLDTMFKNNGSIISCGLFALSNVLDIPVGQAAFLALITDIKIGAFRKEVLDENYAYGVSIESQIEVMRAFGNEKPGRYTLSLNNFMNSLKDGESAIMLVNLTIEGETFGHVITVKKEFNAETGKNEYIVFDNDRKPRYFTEEGFIKAMTGGEAIDKNGDPLYVYPPETGNTAKVTYNAVKDGKNIIVVTASQIVAPNVRAVFANENKEIQTLLKSLIAFIAIKNVTLPNLIGALADNVI